jgi:hypothetical protein
VRNVFAISVNCHTVPFFLKQIQQSKKEFSDTLLGKLHQELHSWNIFEPSDEAAQMNLMFIKFGINLITISTELVFYDWNRIGPNKYAYQPSKEEKLWQQKFLGIDETRENEGSSHSEHP